MRTYARYAVLAGALAGLCLAAGRAGAAPAANYWTPEHITQALQALDRMKAQGLITPAQYQKKRAMLQQRRAGTFKATALSTTNPAEINFVQNGGFEEINKNSAANRSRWLWWGGWSWGGNYENMWETQPEYVHSGKYSARIRCTGKPGRIGIDTPDLPIVPGATEYVATVWAKGEGNNQLFLNFESGVNGSLRQKIGPDWTQVTLRGKPEKDAKQFMFYIYVTGEGTIWLDDVKIVPVGGAMDEE